MAPCYGGPSRVVTEMCRALDARGLATTIATTDADGVGELAVPHGVEIRHERIQTIFFPRIGERFKYSRGLARWLRHHVAEFDVVHVHAVFSHSSIAAARACRGAGVPYIVRPLGSLDPWGLGRRTTVKRALRVLAIDRMLQDAAAVHFTTDDERRLALQTFDAPRTIVIPVGIDDELLADTVPPAEGRRPLVLVLGRLHPVKNLERVIQAFCAITENGARRGWQLVIAGDGDAGYREALQAAAGPALADGRISFRGWVSGQARTDLLDEAAIFVQASYQENFGLSLAEALSRGVPAMVSRTVNLASAVEAAGAGWIVDGGTASMAAALAGAIDDESGRRRRAAAAPASVAEFRWSRIAVRLADLYAAVERRRWPAPVTDAATGQMRSSQG